VWDFFVYPTSNRSIQSGSYKAERNIRRKEKALAEAAALLILEKKAQAIWGDGGEG